MSNLDFAHFWLPSALFLAALLTLLDHDMLLPEPADEIYW